MNIEYTFTYDLELTVKAATLDEASSEVANALSAIHAQLEDIEYVITEREEITDSEGNTWSVWDLESGPCTCCRRDK